MSNRAPRPVLVTGATGFIGSAVARRLAASAEPLRLFCRDRGRLPAGLDRPNIEVVVGDLSDASAIAAAFASPAPKSVIHLAAATKGDWPVHKAATVDGTRRMLESAVEAGVPRFVHISSMSVYDFSALEAGTPLTESSPLEGDNAKRNPYAAAKSEADSIATCFMQTQAIEICVLRPGVVYGPGGPLPLITTFRRLKGDYFLSIGAGKRVLPLVYLNDVVDAIILAEGHPAAANRVFNVVDDRDLPLERRYLEELYSIRAKRLQLIGVPAWPFITMAEAIDVGTRLLPGMTATHLAHGLRRVTNPIGFSAGPIRAQLGWRPRVGFSEGMIRTLRGGAEG